MTNPVPTLSFVIPCYNEEAALPIVLAAVADLSTSLFESGRIAEPAEILLIDDGSLDGTWAAIRAATETHGATGMKLSCNQGQQAALLAGLFAAKGDVTISLDADMQDDPYVVAEMLDRYREGFEIVYGVRAARDKDTFFKRHSARAYYKVLKAMGVDVVPDHAHFRLMSRKAVQALSQFEERNLFLRCMVKQIGFQSTTVSYDRAERSAGESKYSVRQLVGLAVDGITSFSIAPLRFITFLGFLLCGFSIAYAGYSLVMWFTGVAIEGWTSIVLSIYILGGVHMIALGVIGEYIGKIYIETKARPRFIVDQVIAAQEPKKQASKPPMQIAAE